MESNKSRRIETASLGGSLEICRMIMGLWQRAGNPDMNTDMATAVDVMEKTIQSGLGTFDMADHYGDAELIVGQHNLKQSGTARKVSMTKWCPPENGVKTFENTEAAINLSLTRMKQDKIDLLQYHIWHYSDDTYLHNLGHLCTLQKQGKIGLLGLTNTDSAHLQLLLDSGLPISTNQVAVNVIDQRLTQGRMQKLCLERGVGILAYGTLLGGFLSEKWLGEPEPVDIDQLDASKRKYLRFIRAAGGWRSFQDVLAALSTIAEKHGVKIAAVATRYVLDIPAVKAVIVGSRLAPHSTEYIDANLEAFNLQLTEDDSALISKAQQGLTKIPGDCGDEYRRAPFLTAAGDTSDHLKEDDRSKQVTDAISLGKRVEYSSGSQWEPIAGYCRAVRIGSVIRISGTTANSTTDSMSVVGGTSARSQTVHIIDIIENALKALGGSLSDVVRTRIMVRDEAMCEEVSSVHGWAFGNVGVRPANTLVTAGLIGSEMLVEIEAEAEVGCSGNGVLRF